MGLTQAAVLTGDCGFYHVQKEAAITATSSEIFKRSRNWENLQIATFKNVSGKYDIPKMLPVYDLPKLDWIGFNYARTCDPEDRSSHGLHFWLDDYQFQRLWTDPERYVPMLQDFGAVMSPDFSVYNDFPKAVKIWNVYRNAWLACFWQINGMTVIPTLMWGSHDTYEYCFDGYPENSIVAVSTEGNMMSKARWQSFMDGYREMLDRLHPSGIIVHGKCPDEMGGNIIAHVDTFTSQLKKRTEKRAEFDPDAKE